MAKRKKSPEVFYVKINDPQTGKESFRPIPVSQIHKYIETTYADSTKLGDGIWCVSSDRSSKSISLICKLQDLQTNHVLLNIFQYKDKISTELLKRLDKESTYTIDAITRHMLDCVNDIMQREWAEESINSLEQLE